MLCSKIIEDEKFKLAIGTKLDEIIIPTKENTIEIDENESDNEEVQYPKQKQVTWNKAEKMNQRTNEDTLRKKLRIRRIPNTNYGNMTSDISKGVNWVMQENKSKRLRQNE